MIKNLIKDSKKSNAAMTTVKISSSLLLVCAKLILGVTLKFIPLRKTPVKQFTAA